MSGQKPVPGGLIGSAGVEACSTVFETYHPSVQTTIPTTVEELTTLVATLCERLRAKDLVIQEKVATIASLSKQIQVTKSLFDDYVPEPDPNER